MVEEGGVSIWRGGGRRGMVVLFGFGWDWRFSSGEEGRCDLDRPIVLCQGLQATQPSSKLLYCAYLDIYKSRRPPDILRCTCTWMSRGHSHRWHPYIHAAQFWRNPAARCELLLFPASLEDSSSPWQKPKNQKQKQKETTSTWQSIRPNEHSRGIVLPFLPNIELYF